MLKKKYRLPKRTGFAGSQTFSYPFFALRIKNNELLNCRFGFIVSRKIDKRAVVRNRIKRQIRSCIEERLDDMSTGWDILFVLKKKSRDMTRDEICAHTQLILKERGVLK